MFVSINEMELNQHIKFIEQQNTVYKYHNHPDMLKMQMLLDFLLKLQYELKENKIKSITKEEPRMKTLQQSLF